MTDTEQAIETLNEAKPAIVELLRGMRGYCSPDNDYQCDVRLNLQRCSGEWLWALLSGDPSYDQDHRGFWGSGTVCAEDDETELGRLADRLVSDCLDHMFSEDQT